MLNGATLAGTGGEIPPPNLPWKSRLATVEAGGLECELHAEPEPVPAFGD
jgi:hypothetical protein